MSFSVGLSTYSDKGYSINKYICNEQRLQGLTTYGAAESCSFESVGSNETELQMNK